MLFDYPIKCKKVKIWQLMKALRVGEKQCGYSYTVSVCLVPLRYFFRPSRLYSRENWREPRIQASRLPPPPPQTIPKRNLRFSSCWAQLEHSLGLQLVWGPGMSVRSEKWVGHWGCKLLASSTFQYRESGRLCMLYYYIRNSCNLIGLEHWYFS